jgi:hypothetical protein
LKLLLLIQSDSWMGWASDVPRTWQICFGVGGAAEELGATELELATELLGAELMEDEAELMEDGAELMEDGAELMEDGAELAGVELAAELATLPDEETVTLWTELLGSEMWLGSRLALLPTLEMEPKLEEGSALLSFDDLALHFLAETKPADAVSVSNRGRRILSGVGCCRHTDLFVRLATTPHDGTSKFYVPWRRPCRCRGSD